MKNKIQELNNDASCFTYLYSYMILQDTVGSPCHGDVQRTVHGTGKINITRQRKIYITKQVIELFFCLP